MNATFVEGRWRDEYDMRFLSEPGSAKSLPKKKNGGSF